jgi:hypothetical protein
MELDFCFEMDVESFYFSGFAEVDENLLYWNILLVEFAWLSFLAD